MKTLQEHILEKLINNQQVNEKLLINKHFESDDYFIYDQHSEGSYIQIFYENFPEIFGYKNNVYINGKQIEINYDTGWTKEKFDDGIYKVEIKDIDEVENCTLMFARTRIIKVPLFNTSKVKTMCGMFEECKHLESVPKFDTRNCEEMDFMFEGCKTLKHVPLFDTSKVTNMKKMFSGCNNLSDDTQKQWSQIYDFFEENKIK